MCEKLFSSEIDFFVVTDGGGGWWMMVDGGWWMVVVGENQKSYLIFSKFFQMKFR